MSQSREHEREAMPAREEVSAREDSANAESAEAAYALAACGTYAAAHGTGRVNAQAFQTLAGLIGNQAMLGLVTRAVGPTAPSIPDLNVPAPVSGAAVCAQALISVPEFE